MSDKLKKKNSSVSFFFLFLAFRSILQQILLIISPTQLLDHISEHNLLKPIPRKETLFAAKTAFNNNSNECHQPELTFESCLSLFLQLKGKTRSFFLSANNHATIKLLRNHPEDSTTFILFHFVNKLKVQGYLLKVMSAYFGLF